MWKYSVYLSGFQAVTDEPILLNFGLYKIDLTSSLYHHPNVKSRLLSKPRARFLIFLYFARSSASRKVSPGQHYDIEINKIINEPICIQYFASHLSLSFLPYILFFWFYSALLIPRVLQTSSGNVLLLIRWVVSLIVVLRQ